MFLPRDFWVTADHHFGHDIMIEECGRPYKNGTLMDRGMVIKHNETVPKDGVTIIIGDLSLKSAQYKHYLAQIIKKMNGDKILILGNHDVLKPFDYIELGFQSVHTHLEIEYAGHELILCHDPAVHILLGEKQFLLHGHLHDAHLNKINCINVGVDVNDFKPFSIHEICGMIAGHINK